MRFSIERTTHGGHEARRLSGGGLDAVFLPSLGMLGASLRHEGEELLGRTGELERYANAGSTLGIPLLHPWANRLAAPAYELAGRRVELDTGSHLLHLDENGLPIHGIVGPALPWSVVEERAGEAAELVSELDFDGTELLDVFPFRHRIEQRVALGPDGLSVTTTLEATGDDHVPVSFGHHPYVTLPGVARRDWRVELPAMRRLVLDGHSIPTGVEEPFAGLAGPLDRDYDDGFAGLPPGPAFALAGGGRRIELEFLEGYPYAQVYAPSGQDFVCFEPMTAPTNALRSGDGLRVLAPGTTHVARFRISVTA